MVMSPVDITRPDLDRFPEYAMTAPLRCKIFPGDVLYLPAFWWHEVQSRPSTSPASASTPASSASARNMAVNFWYQPFLDKEFPCAECPLDVNRKYRHLLKYSGGMRNFYKDKDEL